MNSCRLYTIMVSILVGIVSCQSSKHSDIRASDADSLLFEIGEQKDFDYMRQMTDSLEAGGLISSLNANRWRGVSYYHEGSYRMSELFYRKALECDIESDEDQVSYIKCARRLSELLLVRSDFEGSLRVANAAINKMEESGVGTDLDYAILLNNIGCSQLNLGQDKEANESFHSAHSRYANLLQNDSTGRRLKDVVVGFIYTIQAYVDTQQYAEAINWINSVESLISKLSQTEVYREYADEYMGRVEIMHAIAMQGLDNPGKATKAYQAFLNTEYSKSAQGRINAVGYLMAAHRYNETAENYGYLDAALMPQGTRPSLDMIQLYLLPKFLADKKAGRSDSAKITAERILDVLDSAIIDQKNSATEELSVLYDTQNKEHEIYRQQAEISKQRIWGVFLVLFLIIVFLIIYVSYHRRQSKILAEKNELLNNANTHIEELSRMKTELIQKIIHQDRDANTSEKKYDVFISYSRANLEEVRTVKKEIEESTNKRCWMDLEGIESGAPRFTESIIEGIEQCDVFLFMRTSQSQSSKYALLELNYATEETKKHVVIVNVDDSEMTKEFKFLYGLTDTIDWGNKPQRDKLIRDIVKWT